MVSLEWLAFSKKPPIIISPGLESMTPFLTHLSKSKYFRAILVSLVLTIILLIMVWARVFYGSMQACQEGETYLKAGQHIKAITFFDRSIHWNTPFSPYVEKSAESLWQISKRAQANGDIRLAIIAVRTLKRGFIAARSFYTPGKDWIEKCDIRVYDLLKIEQGRTGNLKGERIEEESVLDNPQVKGPDILWSIILLTGLLGWIGSVIGFIMSGFRVSHKTKLLSLSNLKWIILWTAFFAIWVIGMMKA